MLTETGTRQFDSALRAAEDWVDDLMQRLQWRDRERVYRALLASLHALRDALPQDAAIRLGAHLPPLLRGLYYEAWRPSVRLAVRSRDGFLERVHDGVHRDLSADPEQIANAVFALLAARIPEAEAQEIMAALPHDLRNLWRA